MLREQGRVRSKTVAWDLARGESRDRWPWRKAGARGRGRDSLPKLEFPGGVSPTNSWVLLPEIVIIALGGCPGLWKFKEILRVLTGRQV